MHAPTSFAIIFRLHEHSVRWARWDRSKNSHFTERETEAQESNMSTKEALELDPTFPDSWSSVLVAGPCALVSSSRPWSQLWLIQLSQPRPEVPKEAVALLSPPHIYWLRQLHLLWHQYQIPVGEGRIAEKATLCSWVLDPGFANDSSKQVT